MNDYLPLGSVITLKNAQKRLMIAGRQQQMADGSLYDYSAVLWPEGMIRSDQMYLFNAEDIARIWFIGLQDSEEFAFRSALDEQKRKH